MATKAYKIRWTDPQKEVADMISNGASFSDILAAGYSKGMYNKVTAALKKGQKPYRISTEPSTGRGVSVIPSRGRPGDPSTTVRSRVVDPVSIGSLLIIPEDCYMSQHGWYLLHDTYKLTQQQFNYGGTMGEFLVEICQVFRDILSYPLLPFVYEEPIKEVLDERRAEDNGTGIQEEAGGGDYTEELADEDLNA